MEIGHDKGKRNTLEHRRVPRSSVRFQVTAINGNPVPNAYILDISPLGAKMELPPLAIPTMSLELKFLVPGESLETRVIGEVVWLVDSDFLDLISWEFLSSNLIGNSSDLSRTEGFQPEIILPTKPPSFSVFGQS